MNVSSATATPPGAPELVGRPLVASRYALFAKMAEGGMAGVYLAWDAAEGAWRALKVLLPEFAERANLRTRFASEAQALAAIDHPHVVRVYDISADSPLPYLVMELAEAGSLHDWLERHGQMPARLAVEVALQISRGLGAAHASGVVHRDVKPQNVLIGSDGRCMLTDLGIARVQFIDHQTRTGSSMGTVGYMAPEQRSDAKVVDARADVYGVGALLYKLVTGVVLTDLFLVEVDPRLLAPVPQVLRPVVLRACRRDRDQRFQSAEELAVALEGVLGSLPGGPGGLELLVGGEALDRGALDQDFSQLAPLLEGSSAGARSGPRRPASATRGGAVPWAPPSHPAGSATPPPGDDEGAPRAAPTGPGATADARPTAEPRRGFDLRTILVVVGLALALAGTGGTALAAWMLHRDAAREEGARTDLYQAMEREADLVAELERRGAAADGVRTLRGLYRAWESESEPAARLELADRYAHEVLRLADETLPADGADMTGLRARTVAQRHRAWALAVERWRRHAEGPFGRSATWIGAGPRPALGAHPAATSTSSHDHR